MATGTDIRAGRAFVELFLKNNSFIRGLADMRRRIDQFGKDIQAIGTRMAGMGVAIGAPLLAAVKRFADFDDAMRAVGAVARASDADLASMTETAKRLGATTSFTAVQVANLMVELGRAGFVYGQINEMTGAVLDLARASGTDATVSAGILAASIRQFRLNAEDTTRVADALTLAANASFNSVESLGEALAYAGPVAADMGMQIEDALAILGGLGNVGIQGSEAGTALRRLLTLTAAEAKDMRRIFGVSFVDAANNARPLVDVLAEVNEVTRNMPTAQRAAKYNEAFGLLGITSASAIGRSVGDIRAMRAELAKAGGTAADTAAKMDAGLGGSFRILLSAIEGVALGIGEQLEPTVKTFADTMTGVAGSILAFVKRNQDLIVTIGKVAAGLVAAGTAVVGMGLGFQVLAAAIGGVLLPITALNGVLGLMLGPVGIIAAGLVGAAISMQRFGGAAQSVLAPLSAFGRRAMEIFGAMSRDFGDSWGEIVEALKAGDVERAAQIAMMNFRLEVVRTMTEISKSTTGIWSDTFGDLAARIAVGDLQGAWQTLADGIEATWTTMLEKLSSRLQEFVSSASAWGGAIGEAVRKTFMPSTEEYTERLQKNVEARKHNLEMVMKRDEQRWADLKSDKRGASAYDMYRWIQDVRDAEKAYQAAQDRVQSYRDFAGRRQGAGAGGGMGPAFDRLMSDEEHARRTEEWEKRKAEIKERIARREAEAEAAKEVVESEEMKAFRERVKGRSAEAEDALDTLYAELHALLEKPTSSTGKKKKLMLGDESGAVPGGGGPGGAAGGSAGSATSSVGTFLSAGLSALAGRSGGVAAKTLDEIRSHKKLLHESAEAAKRTAAASERIARAAELGGAVFA